MNSPKVLLLDIETSPILAQVWGLWDQNVGLNQIKQDWSVIAWAAKWLGDPPSKIMYMDQRKSKDVNDDKKILQGIWKLIDEADILITQNGKAFDIKKLNARFILNGMKPPSSFKHIDTCQIARRRFGFTSNKLEYMTHKLNTKYKKLKHNKYAGFDLWKECLAGNKDAWREMEKYNKYDVLALEEVYKKLQPWDNSVSFNAYNSTDSFICNCGSTTIRKNGYAYTASGKFQRYACTACGAEVRSKQNQYPKERTKTLKVRVS